MRLHIQSRLMRKIVRWMKKNLEIVCCIICATYALYWVTTIGQNEALWLNVLVCASAVILYFRAAKRVVRNIHKWLYPTERN